MFIFYLFRRKDKRQFSKSQCTMTNKRCFLFIFALVKLTETMRRFIREHAADDVQRLLLSAAQYPSIDVPFAVMQIEARCVLKDKLPSWHACDALIFSSKLAAEQCSSELTAQYKLRLLEGEQHLCDLTGGLGVDSYFFAKQVKQVCYVERDKACFDATMRNFSVLSARNIEGRNEEAAHALSELTATDVFYIDPARRGTGNRRMFALSDCEPDIVQLLPEMLRKAPKVMAKLSPMLDLSHTLALLPQTTDVHVVSVKNECKELLFVLRRGNTAKLPCIHCINIVADSPEQAFCFTPAEEQGTPTLLAESAGAYLYEPNASILKAGAYKQTAMRMGVRKLHVNSHLYTSDEEVLDFPGRSFRIEEMIPFSGKICRTIARKIPQANLTARNFPLSVEELRKRTKITDGGEVYLFATTLADNQKVLIRCTKLSQLP